jgi:hypothetical protein
LDGTAFESGLARDSLAGARSAPSLRLREPFVVRVQAGRLLELQVFDLGLPEDVEALARAVFAAAAELGVPAILLSDNRAAGPFSQEVGDSWSRVMRQFNARVARSAILLDPANETFNLQLERVVRCAGSTRRRWFCDPFEARAWLADVASPSEMTRLDEVLGT